MSGGAAWNDGDVVAIGWHAVFNYQFAWDRLEEVDPTLALDAVQRVLAQLRSAGIDVGPDTPARLQVDGEVAALVGLLREFVERIRNAVRVAFDEPEGLPDQVWATCRMPRVYMGLPDADLAMPDAVEIVHLGDLPPYDPQWQQRGTLVRYTNLQSLTLFDMQLGRHGVGIDLPHLAQLRCLDLRENRLAEVPPEVLGCRALRWLHIGDNPISTLPDLSALPALTFLGLAQTRVPPVDIAALRQQRPELRIDTAA